MRRPSPSQALSLTHPRRESRTVITFPQAYEQFGRDSMAIAKACNITEAEAYNMIGARADRDVLGPGFLSVAERRAKRHGYYVKFKARQRRQASA